VCFVFGSGGFGWFRNFGGVSGVVWSLRDLDVRGGRFTPTMLLEVRRWCCSG
jgi:hypothetical protein